MSLQLEIWRGDEDYLLVNVSGEYDLFGFKEMAKRVRVEAQEQDVRRLMIDLTSVAMDAAHWEGEHLGAYIGLSSERRLRSAIVVQSTDVVRAFQDVARAQSLDLCVCGDRDSALAWLMAEGVS